MSDVGDHQQAEAQDVGEAMPDALRRARVVEAGGAGVERAEVAVLLDQLSAL